MASGQSEARLVQAVSGQKSLFSPRSDISGLKEIQKNFRDQGIETGNTFCRFLQALVGRHLLQHQKRHAKEVRRLDC